MTLDTETRTAPFEPTTPIRPSEAIRLGCLTTAPGEGNEIGDDGSACAWGALRIGYGDDRDAISAAERQMSNHGPVPCPATCKPGYHHHDPLPITWAIRHLNDGYCLPLPEYMANGNRGWTRERIADWLEGLGL